MANMLSLIVQRESQMSDYPKARAITVGDVPSEPACGITASGSSQEAEFQFPAIVEVDIWNFHFCWRIPSFRAATD